MFLSFYDMQASMSHRFEHQFSSADCGRHLLLMPKAEEKQGCNDKALAPLCKGSSQKPAGFLTEGLFCCKTNIITEQRNCFQLNSATVMQNNGYL
jgi:hypothetical protein